MKILVTGATGFVGSHLCRKLISQGHQVFGLVRNPKKLENENLSITMVPGSLNYDKENPWINELPKDLDCVIHVAGIVHSFNKEDFHNINTKATKQLVDDLEKRYSKIKFIFISSLAAAGPGEKDETMPLQPVSQYGISKKQAEELLPQDWDLTIIRPPMIIGPGDPAILDVYKMVKSKIILTAGEEARYSRYSFVCVHDLVNAITKCLRQNNREKKEFFISHQRIITFEEIIEEIAKCMYLQPLYLPLPVSLLKFVAHILKLLPIEFRLTPDKINEITEPSWVCSNKVSRQELNISYEWDLPETIKITYEDYLKRKWI